MDRKAWHAAIYEVAELDMNCTASTTIITVTTKSKLLGLPIAYSTSVAPLYSPVSTFGFL